MKTQGRGTGLAFAFVSILRGITGVYTELLRKPMITMDLQMRVSSCK
jgi:hypothetical protein